MAVKSSDQRPRRLRPVGRHAVARQVARHQVQQPGHRRRAGEPEDRDRAEVVDRAEHLAEVLVREVGERAAVRRAAVWNASGGISSVVASELPISRTLMISAAVRSSFFVLRDAAGRVLLGVVRHPPRRAASPRRRSRIPTGRAPASETAAARRQHHPNGLPCCCSSAFRHAGKTSGCCKIVHAARQPMTTTLSTR